MTGDHHDRTARRATLLVTAAAEILGTHRHRDQPPTAAIVPRGHRREPPMVSIRIVRRKL
jgi:hypothetical protein